MAIETSWQVWFSFDSQYYRIIALQHYNIWRAALVLATAPVEPTETDWGYFCDYRRQHGCSPGVGDQGSSSRIFRPASQSGLDVRALADWDCL